MKFKDARINKLIAALQARFPGTTIITGPMRDAPYSGETHIQLLNAPTEPPTLVSDEGIRLINELWGDDWIDVYVGGVGPESTAKYYSHHLKKPHAARSRARPTRRRKAASPAR